MLARYISLMCFLWFVGSYMTSHATSPPVQIKEEVRSVSSFTQVHIEGPFNVRLHTNRKHKPSLKVRGDVMDLARIDSCVKHHVLYINVYQKRERFRGKPRLRMGSADLEINVPRLYRFAYQGQGTITAHKIHASPLDISIENTKNATWSGRLGLRYLTLRGSGSTHITGIHSPNLNVKLEDSPHVMLEGEASLRNLYTEGDGWLKLYWVKGGRVMVRSVGSTRVSLAGSVDVLDGCFSGTTRFDGHYLRAKESFVKTNDQAVAEISSVNDQHTLAQGASDIYYYNRPKRRTDYMRDVGAVLDMRSEELKLIQPSQMYDH